MPCDLTIDDHNVTLTFRGIQEPRIKKKGSPCVIPLGLIERIDRVPTGHKDGMWCRLVLRGTPQHPNPTLDVHTFFIRPELEADVDRLESAVASAVPLSPDPVELTTRRQRVAPESRNSSSFLDWLQD